MAARVELRFLRLNTWPLGAGFVVVWDGLFAENGDGIPGATPGLLNLDAPLTLAPVEIWPLGKAGDGEEPDGEDVDGEGSNWGCGFGDGEEVDGEGEDGQYNDWVIWRTPFLLRDGQYTFGVYLVDAIGNRQPDPIETVSIAVRGVPRPPDGLRFEGWDDVNGRLLLAWQHSLDIA